MPTHDWTRVISGIFHDFHQSWAAKLSTDLNTGGLPEEFYALVERVSEEHRPDDLTLEAEDGTWETMQSGNGGGALAIAEHPPKVKYTEEQEREIYVHAADRVAVYHASGDRVVAYIEIVSPGNKHSPHELSLFFHKLDEAIERGCHLLIIDVLPPGKHDPHGVHAAFWEHRCGDSHGVSAEQPLGLSAYRVERVGDNGVVPHAYFEPVGVGESLPDMPLFLTVEHYVNVPLERTYQEAWNGVPGRWKRVIEGGG